MARKQIEKPDANLRCLHETFSINIQDESKWMRKIFNAKSNLRKAREIILISEKWVMGFKVKFISKHKRDIL